MLRDTTPIAQIAENLEDLTAGRKHSSTLSLVGVQRLHELDLIRRVLALARGRVNLTSAAPSFTAVGRIRRAIGAVMFFAQVA